MCSSVTYGTVLLEPHILQAQFSQLDKTAPNNDFQDEMTTPE